MTWTREMCGNWEGFCVPIDSLGNPQSFGVITDDYPLDHILCL